MKAILLRTPGGPEVLEVVDLPLPGPGPGEVRVAARAIGVGRPDALLRRGVYQWMPPLPAIPGNEMAGIVDAVGAGVSTLVPGQRVVVSARELAQRGGCYAEAICVPEGAPFALPDAIGFEAALSLGNVQLALALLACNGQAPMRSILVPGAAGGVAGSLAQVARAQGLRVIGTASTDEKRAHAMAQGFDEVIEGDASRLAARVLERTDGRGVDMAFDHVGGASFVACLQALAPMGMLVSYNAVAGPPAVELFAEMRRLLQRSLAVRTYSIHTLDENPLRRRALMAEAIALMTGGQVRAAPSVRFALEDAEGAHTLLDASPLGKIVLLP